MTTNYPKDRTSGKSRKPPDTHDQIISYSFESKTYQIPVSQHDDAATILQAFSQAVGTSKIEILDDRGIKLQLGYTHIKANSKVYVQRLNDPSQHHLNTGKASQKVADLLTKIMTDWKVHSMADILPPDCAPKRKNFDGDKATFFDPIVRVTHPRDWTAIFATALQRLSDRTKERHEEAIGMLRDVRNARHQDKKDMQWDAWETLTRDISTVVERLKDKAENLNLAADAVNVVESIAWKGDLDEAIERVEEGTDIEGREEDLTAINLCLRCADEQRLSRRSKTNVNKEERRQQQKGLVARTGSKPC